MTEDY